MTGRSRLITWPFRHSFSALLLAALVLLAGLVTYGRLPQAPIPPSEARLTFHLLAPGSGAAFLTQQVAPVLVRALNAMPEIAAVETEARVGHLELLVEPSRTTPREALRAKLHSQLENLLSALPLVQARWTKEVVTAPLMEVAVSSGEPDVSLLRDWVESRLVGRLREVDGVVSITLRGAGAREVQVAPDARRLAALGLSFADVVAAFGNLHAPLTSLTSIETLPLMLSNGTHLALSEVAQVSERDVPRVRQLQLNGRPVVIFSIRAAETADTVVVGQRVRAQLAWLRANGQIPDDIHLDFLTDQSQATRLALTRLVIACGTGLVFAGLVLVVGWRCVRAPLFVAAVLALSASFTLVALKLLGHSLNVLTLGGMALGAAVNAAVSIRAWQVLTASGSLTRITAKQLLISGLTTAAGVTVFLGLCASADHFTPVVFPGLPLAAAAMALAAPGFTWLLSGAFAGRVDVVPVSRLARRWRVPWRIAAWALLVAAWVGALAGLHTERSQLVFRIEGPQATPTTQMAMSLLSRLQALPVVAAVHTLDSGLHREFAIRLNAHATEQGITLADVALAISLVGEGRPAGDLVEHGRSTPVVLRLAHDTGDVRTTLARLPLRGEGQGRRVIFLGDVAELAPMTVPVVIRQQLERAHTDLWLEVTPGVSLQELQHQVGDALAEITHDPEYRWSILAPVKTWAWPLILALILALLTVASLSSVRRQPRSLAVTLVSAVIMACVLPLYIDTVAAHWLGFGLALCIVTAGLHTRSRYGTQTPLLFEALTFAAVFLPLVWWGGTEAADLRSAAAVLVAVIAAVAMGQSLVRAGSGRNW